MNAARSQPGADWTFARLSVSARRGVVLIVVLVLVVMIAFAGFGFVSEMTTEYEATRINGDLLQAQQVMASAENYLLAHVARQQQPQQETSPDSVLSESANPFQAVTLASLSESGTSDGTAPMDSEWRFAVIRNLSTFDAMRKQQRGTQAYVGAEEIDLLNNIDTFAAPEFGIENESAKLNLGRVLYWDTVEPGRGRRALLHIPGMTEEAADCILDWIDDDDTPRPSGAEQNEYRQQQERNAQQINVQPRNGLPQTLTELLLVRGVTRAAFFGSGGSASDTASASWERYLTLTSAEPTQISPPRIVLNQLALSDLADLEKRLSAAVSPGVARYVALALMVGVNSAPASLPPMNPLAVDLNSLPVVSINGMLKLPDLIDSSVVVNQPGNRQRVDSPFRSDDPESLRMFARLEQLVTTVDTTRPVVRGRVNILLASEEVLRALTDDPAIASQIVQQRQSLSGDELHSSAWLLSRRIADLQTYRRLYPDITTGGNVYTGEIVVYRAVGGPFLRRKITIDAANGVPRRVNWLDKTSVPLPLTLQQLEPQEGLFAVE
ncbi:MAG: type II secretion system protein GspK [Planctomycetaceae bacterium]